MEARKLTDEERVELQAELNQVITRLTQIAPRYYCPALDATDGEAAENAHDELTREKKELERHRDYLVRELETGIKDAPIFDRPLSFGIPPTTGMGGSHVD